MRSTLCCTLSVWTTVLAGCADDAGDTAFVQQVIPAVLGRKPIGSAEVRALEHVLDDHGGDRQVVIDALVSRPEYVDYWTLVIADALRVRRGGQLTASSTCWGTPLLTNTAETNLANHIATSATGTAFGSAWNMTDAVRGAILADDLGIAWLAYVPTIGDLVTTGTLKDDAAMQFERVYLDRSPDCIGCHSSADAMVDGWTGWDRHQSGPHALDQSYFRGAGLVGPTLLGSYNGGSSLYQTTGGPPCASCHGTSAQLLVNRAGGGSFELRDRLPVLSDAELESVVASGRGAMPAYAFTPTQIADLEMYLRTQWGSPDDVNEFFRVDPSSNGTRAWGMSPDCGEGLTASTLLNAGTRQSGFAQQQTDSPDALDLSDWLRQGFGTLPTFVAADPVEDAGYTLPTIDGRSAFAYRVAEVIADAVIRHVTGRSTVTANGFSRNLDQATLRHDLVEAMVVVDGGRTRVSLVNALYELHQANLLPPADTSSINTDPYFPWLGLEPWVESDPRGAPSTAEGADANSVGDAIHRYDGRTLLWQVAWSLGWGKPAVFPSTSYPNEALTKNLGAFWSESLPGTDVWDLSTFLYFEEKFGSCYVSTQSGADWIHDLRTAGTGSSRTVGDAFAAVRDRLLSSPTFSTETDELAIIDGHLAATSLTRSTVLSTLNAAGWNALEDQLRGYCGALVVTPQYTLGGIPVLQSTPAAPAWTVCWTSGGEACTETSLYNQYDAAVP